MRNTVLATLSLALSCALITLNGCSIGSIELSGAPIPSPVAGLALSAHVRGGQQPISGAILQLYVAGMPAAPTTGSPTGGLGQGATGLFKSGSMTVGSTNNYYPASGANGATCPYTVGNTNSCTALPQTDANGDFTLTADYTCPSSTSQVYAVATGGNPGLASGTNNPYVALMAGLGSCGNLSSATYIDIDEVTTVAAVFALNNFMTAPDGTHAASAYASQGGSTAGVGVDIGASSGPVNGYGPDKVQTQQVGLANAFRMISNIANNTTGVATPLNSWATNYPAKINTIADILAACVNSTGVGAPCSTLMADAAANSVTPQDTIQLAWTMAQNPMLNTSTLTNFSSSTAPFQPTMTTVADWTIVVGLAPVFDSANSNPGANAVSGVQAHAIDELGHVWMFNQGFISEIDANGAAISGEYTTYSVPVGQGTSACTQTVTHTISSSAYDMVIDQHGILWGGNSGEAGAAAGVCGTSANSDRSLYRINTDSAAKDSSTMMTGYWETSGPGALVVDASNDIWWNTNSGAFQIITSGGTYYGAGSAGSNTAFSSAADMAGNMWFLSSAGCTGGSLLYQSPVSTILSTSNENTDTAPTAGFFTSTDSACSIQTNGKEVPLTASVPDLHTIATDANNGIWGVNYGTSPGTINYFATQSNAWSTATSTATHTPGTAMSVLGAQAATTTGLNAPWGLAVDGGNHAWVGSSVKLTSGSNFGGDHVLQEYSVTLTNDGNSNISSINLLNTNTAVTPEAYGFVFPSVSNPFPQSINSVAADPSGNLWLSSYGTATWISVVVGAAKPTLTPISLQTEYSLVGQLPQ